jgi:hypothetical protein
MKHGKFNISAGLLFMAGFMVFGFVLIYLRDFAPDKAQWVADYAVGKHFESRLAHVHGNLFAFLNIVSGISCCGYHFTTQPVGGYRGSPSWAC